MRAEAAIVESRLATCNACEKAMDKANPLISALVQVVSGSGQDESRMYCAQCLCPIQFKVRLATNSCPLKKWSS